MSDFSQLDYPQLLQYRVKLFAQAGGTRPAVWLLEKDGARAVLKDYNICARLYALLIGPLFVWREVKALRRLDGLAGIPRLLRQAGARAFVMEFVPAERLARKRREEWPDPDFGRLKQLVIAMHERGVAHGDLRRSSNILFDHEGQPFLVDFVSHVQRGGAWNLPWNWLFAQICRADRMALAKLMLRVDPGLLSEEEQARVGHHGWFDRGARALGQGIRSIGRALFLRGQQ